MHVVFDHVIQVQVNWLLKTMQTLVNH